MIRPTRFMISIRNIPLAVGLIVAIATVAAVLMDSRSLITFQSSFQDALFQTSAVDVDVDVVVDVQGIVTHWNDTRRKKPPTIYFCHPNDGNGMGENKHMLRNVLPEYQFEDLSKVPVDKRHQKMPDGFKDSNEYDLFIKHTHPDCSQTVLQWLITHFHGHIVFFSGESDEEDPVQGGDKASVHGFGPVRHPRTEDMTLYYMQLTWWHLFQDALSPLAMTDPSRRPRGNQTSYMMYANSNCVPFREEAVGRLSEFGLVHCGGKCAGRPPSGDTSNLTKIPTGVSLRNWWANTRLYSDYRFCFVMEHVNHAAYITEKILMAFIGGCIPIYYGSSGIFDVFNEKAFIFYIIVTSDPQPAPEKVKPLESDKELNEQMLREPIELHIVMLQLRSPSPSAMKLAMVF
jgi:hypothetical protein